MSIQQFQDRVRQALATDARERGLDIGELHFMHALETAREIATLYPTITGTDIHDALDKIRTDITQEKRRPVNNDELLAKLYNRLAEALEEIDDAITDPTQEGE